MSMHPSTAERRTVLCSAKGCRVTAAYGLLWNNPKLHAPERRGDADCIARESTGRRGYRCCRHHHSKLLNRLGTRHLVRGNGGAFLRLH